MPAIQSQFSRRPLKNGAPSSTHVAIIGAGRGGTALMEIFATDPLVKIVCVAEIQANAPGILLAKRLGIPVTRDYRRLLDLERVDLIIDVSGDAKVWEML
ncbi:MAG TPA: Gfo/Idh/MocA family oxidoreductase, partial [Nitrospiraceae bacterium]